MNKIKPLLTLIVALILIGFFGFVGYVYCKDNNYDVIREIVFGILTPFYLGLMGLFIEFIGISGLIKYHKTFQQGCIKFGLVCDDLEIIDTNYFI